MAKLLKELHNTHFEEGKLPDARHNLKFWADLLGSYQLMKLVTQREEGSELYMGTSSELIQKTWSVFVREYYGSDDPQVIQMIENKLHFYVIIRSMAAVTFSDLIPKEKVSKVTEQISNTFMAHVDAVMKDNWLET